MDKRDGGGGCKREKEREGGRITLGGGREGNERDRVKMRERGRVTSVDVVRVFFSVKGRYDL